VERPLSIENRWDLLYRDYPEVYDAFSNMPYTPTVYEELARLINLRGMRIADVGAGTGKSTLALARYARAVIGIEHEAAMLRVAIDKHAGLAMLAGDALALPLANGAVDLVTGITLALYPADQYRDFIREGLRVARRGVVYAGIAPGWYGGELEEEVGHSDESLAVIDAIFVEEFGFAYEDVFLTQEYGTLEAIVSTYGFIFGKRVIEYLRRMKKTSILWKVRVYYLLRGE
jgi:ubiquinone/menaquinone biosynthesis C-methylase UbiE